MVFKMTGMDTQITRVPTTTGDDGNGFDQQLNTAQQDDPPVPTYPNLRQTILYDDFDTNDAFAPAQGAPVSVMTDADDETHKGLNTDHVFFGTLGGLGMALVGGSLRSTAADQKKSGG